MNVPHEIRRLTIQFSSPVSETYRRQLEQDILSLLESIFDQYFPGEDVSEISSISLDLGTIPSTGFNAEFKRRLVAFISDEFSKLDSRSQKPFTESDSASVLTPAQLLADYLVHGYLNGTQISLNQLFRTLLEQDPNGLENLLANIQSSSVVRLRLLNQVDFQWIEKYWTKTYGTTFITINRINRSLMERLETPGQHLGALNQLLHKTTYDFLVSGDVWERTEQRYLSKVHEVLMQNANRINIPHRTIRGIFRNRSSTYQRNTQTDYDAFIRFAVSGGTGRRGLPKPDAQTIRHLADWILSEPAAWSVGISRIISVLEPSQARYFLEILGPQGPERIRIFLYLSNLFSHLFLVDLLTYYRAQIRQVLEANGNEQEDWNTFFEQVLPDLGNRKGLPMDQLTLRISKAIDRSFHKEVNVLRTWLKTILKIKPAGRRQRDPLGSWIQFIRTGIWSEQKSPQEIFASHLKDAPGYLLKSWRQVSDMNLAWSRLLLQHQWSEVSEFLKMAYPDDAAIINLRKQIKDSTNAQRVLQIFLQLRRESILSPDDFRAEFKRRLKAKSDTSPENAIQPTVDPPQEEFAGSNFVRMFIHWIRFGTFLSAELESLGTHASLRHIRISMAAEVVRQLRAQSDLEPLLQRLWLLLPEEERSPWFDLLASRFRERWPVVVQASQRFQINPSDLFIRLATISMANSDIEPTDFRLDGVHKLFSSGADEIKPNEWLSLFATSGTTGLNVPKEWSLQETVPAINKPPEQLTVGISLHHDADFSFPDLVRFVLQHRNFPSWSTLYAPFQFAELLISVVGKHPSYWNRFFAEEFRQPQQLENVLALLGTDRTIQLISEVWPPAANQILETVEILAKAHRTLGEPQSIKTYFESKLIKERYRDQTANWIAIVQIVLQDVGPDFGFTLEEHRRLLAEQKLASMAIRIYLARPSEVLNIIPSIDVLLHLLRTGKSPWWAPQSNTSQIPELIQEILNNSAQDFFRRMENTSDSERLYRNLFSQIDTNLFLKLTQVRFPSAAGTLKFAATIILNWPTPLSRPGWFYFSWNFLANIKWDAAVYASAFVDFISSIIHISTASTAKQLLGVMAAVEENDNQKRIFRTPADVLLGGSHASKPLDAPLPDDGWKAMLTLYLQTGALARNPAYPIVSFSSFLNGIKGYLENNIEDTAQAIRKSLGADSIFNRLIWHEPLAFLEFITQATIGDQLRTLDKYWGSVRHHIKTLYGNQYDDEWWTRVWSEYLLEGVRSNRKPKLTNHQSVAVYLLRLERRINVSVSFSPEQLVRRGLPETLVDELWKGGSKLLSAHAESNIILPATTRSEWEYALRLFLVSGTWPAGYSVPEHLPLPVLLRSQPTLSSLEIRQMVIKLLGEQTTWSDWRKRNDLESAESLLQVLFPTETLELLQTGNLLIDILIRNWPVLSPNEMRWAFIRNVVDANKSNISTRLAIAKFAGNTIRLYGLDAAVFINALRSSGYPKHWQDAFSADAGLVETTEIPSPVQLVAEKVAFYDPQATLHHFLKTGAWPMNVEHAGLDLATFFSKARQQPAYKIGAMLDVIQRSLSDDQVRKRLAEYRNYKTFRALRDFIFPNLSPEFEMLGVVTLNLLIGQSQEKVLYETSYTLLVIMAEPNSQYVSFGQALQHLMVPIRTMSGADRFHRDDLLKANFPPSWVDLLRKTDGMVYEALTPETNVSFALGEADLLYVLLTERELPWWAERFGVSDVEEPTIRRLVENVLRIDPNALINRIQSDLQPEDVLNALSQHLNQIRFFTLISAWPPAVKNTVIPFTRLIVSAYPSLAPDSWYAFVTGHLIKYRPFIVDKFISAGLTYLERLIGRKTFELYQLFAASEFGKRADRDAQNILDEISGLISQVPDADEETMARSPVIEFSQIVLGYLRTGAVPSGQLANLQNRTAFLQYLRYQLSLGSSGLGDTFRLAVRETATRERLLHSENSEFLGLITQVLFPQLFRKSDQYRRQLYRFFQNQNLSLAEERFNHIYFGALIKLYSEQITDANGIDKVFSMVFNAVKTFLQYNSVIRADSLRRFGFGNEILEALIGNDAGVEESPEIPESFDKLVEEIVEIQNAGLVILWPYLGRYFELLDMTEKSEFKSEEMASRAVLLLQFMATGISSANEHELLLNKLLCGILPSVPVLRQIELTENEKAITEMMLKGVLQNWEKLRNSSIDALREGFLMRDGYLREKETVWELHVEKKTLDILMKSMPWSFGTVKLPWMKKRLVVEWL